MGEPTRLDDAAIRRRMARLDELLEKVERFPGPGGELAVEALRTLAEVYGEALARLVDLADASQDDRLAEDELLSHLLVLHDIHPHSLPARLEQALDGVRQYVRSRGGRVELEEIDGETARVRLTGAACQSCSSPALERAVTESVLALAPELTGVETVQVPADHREPVIPVDALLSRTAGTGKKL